MRSNTGAVLAGLVSAMLLSACGEDELILPGPREAIRPGAETVVAENVARALSPGASVANASWTHVNGSPSHMIAHPALGASLSLAWSANIGEGNGRKHRITADPIVAGGRVFTLDSRARVTALTTAGGEVWTQNLAPANDNPEDASGGGLAFSGGRLFATSGFGTLTALDPATGRVIWAQDFEAAVTAAPTVVDGVAYVATRNGIGWAVDAENGKVLWQVFGAQGQSGLVGGASPTLAGPLVIFPFSSGQLVAVERGTGRRAWLGSVAGQRSNRAFSQIADITGAPVSDGVRVYAGNHSGRTSAFDATTGARAWSVEEGALNPIWRSGDSVFLVSDENALVRIDASSGDIVWTVPLPFFEEERQTKRKATFVHYGPVLAGGRLIVASDDGLLRMFDPATGGELASLELPEGAVRNPVVAGGVLYLVTESGTLHAFR